MQVGAGEQRVVVEHLLEVGDEPGLVDRVAGEAAADLVVDAAVGHRVERHLHHVLRAVRQQQLERRRGRELGRSAEPAVARVGHHAQAADGGADEVGAEQLGGGLEAADRPELVANSGRRGADPLPLRGPGLHNRLHHHAEAGHPMARLGREVRAAVEGHALGVEEDGHGPAAVAGHPLHRLHVDRVQVGAFLAVDLDADEVLVHVGRGLCVLERLALHHMAPVTGRVADRKQDRLLLALGALQRLRPPRVPLDRVVLVLKEVGTGLLCKAIGHRFQATRWHLVSGPRAGRRRRPGAADIPRHGDEGRCRPT